MAIYPCKSIRFLWKAEMDIKSLTKSFMRSWDSVLHPWPQKFSITFDSLVPRRLELLTTLDPHWQRIRLTKLSVTSNHAAQLTSSILTSSKTSSKLNKFVNICSYWSDIRKMSLYCLFLLDIFWTLVGYSRDNHWISSISVHVSCLMHKQ